MSVRSIAAACAALVAFGCATAPRISPPPPRSIPVLRDTQLLPTPKDLKADTGYPPTLTRQTFVWERDTSTWRIQFFGGSYGTASILLRKAYDLTNAVDQAQLHLQFRPASLARHLTLALVDADFIPGRVAVEVPLGPRVNPDTDDDRFVEIRIPLADFGRSGRILFTPGSTNMPVSTLFDWSDFREIRVTAVGIPRQEIVLRNIHIDF